MNWKKQRNLYHLRRCLWPQEQENLGVCTRTQAKIQLVKLLKWKKIETQQSVDGSKSVDAFSSVMGPEHPGRLRLYGRGVIKTTLKGKVGQFMPTSNATNDTMQERIRKMEEQKRTMRQEITADVIAQLQRAGLINPNVLATLSISSLGEATSASQAGNQLIRRQSEGSNNEGGELKC